MEGTGFPPPSKPFTVKMRSGGGIKNKTRPVSLPFPILLEGTHPPRPHSSATIFLKTHYATEDEQTLKYVPYFGDDDKEDVVSDLYDLEDREKQMEFGSEYQERDTNDIIDETLSVIKQRLKERNMDDDTTTNTTTKERSTLQTRIHETLALIMDEYIDRIHERYQLLFIKDKNDDEKDQEPTTMKKPKEITSYLAAVDTYRNLLCRRCFTYDCNSHGILSKPNLDLQGELAVRKELEGFWDEAKTKSEAEKKLGANEIEDDQTVAKTATIEVDDAQGTKRTHDEITDPVFTAFTPTDKFLCERAFLMFQGDVDKIALVLGTSRTLVEEYITSANLKCKQYETVKEDIFNEAKKRKKKKNFEKSMNNYNLAWLKRVEGAEIHPRFIPCDHDGVCSEEDCSCIINAFFCTKHCVWGLKGRNCFRGCACKGRCTTGSCSCFAAKRECDPDLCKSCDACTDPPNLPATQQRCRNDNIGMRRHCHLLLGESSIADAGWGIYSKHALKKGDFVHEYVGEVISQEEAERRGRIYDKVNRSYLFNLTSDFVVDASRKGNKSRFANHSQKPNCYTKMMTVNGDVRIGLYAKEDIEAQSEVSLNSIADELLETSLVHRPYSPPYFVFFRLPQSAFL
jgi:histone-lysine N-methyltransferase EZH2